MSKKNSILSSNAFYTLISIIIGFIVGALLLSFAKINPMVAYKQLFNGIFGKPKFMAWCLIYAAPLIFTGLSVAFSFKTGVFNIGAEGQFVVGTLTACIIGILVKAPAIIHIPLCFIGAALAGGIWGAIVGILKIKKGVNEVLSYIMFNWIAFYLSNFVVNLTVIHKEGGGEATKDIADTARILAPKAVIAATGASAANWGFILAILFAIIVWFIINRTTLGFKLRAVGFSNSAAEYAGIDTGKSFLTAMAFSGALAGIGGAIHLMGMSGRIPQFAGQEGYGFQGITVALIASSNPIACIFAGIFYGAMKYGGGKLSLVNAPSEVVDIIMGIIILFIAISSLFRNLFINHGKKGAV
ncbi:ABC transporter permease [Lachnoanaerobaculum sp. Marseille-Q4761]|uniref:ABC transporter permease n=1 Tax=Lachnoanaerobaculum sp. Marseille-Q4761 TaxID=2819511 RepID=UPI001AA1D1D5|nr:ABC transporter permease [Lachnoanaerobaculum sp. Marseille-Q4761]MBO1871743.1 ABC transporter permease [Lachnoanaerobaculum sp. Marseille-Q4761]